MSSNRVAATFFIRPFHFCKASRQPAKIQKIYRDKIKAENKGRAKGHEYKMEPEVSVKQTVSSTDLRSCKWGANISQIHYRHLSQYS